MAEWAQREYSKADIDRAGATLVPWWKGDVAEPPNLGELVLVTQNWRSSHAFPLNSFQMGLRARARRLDPQTLIAQRLKRFPSMLNKLTREPHMQLTQMQDLGGCRAILTNVQSVFNLAEELGAGGLMLGDTGHKYYDYINHPKLDGYRSFHIVGRYVAREKRHEPWNGQRIEVQVRSRLQHAFATAVETVDTFTRARLKAGAGTVQWKRFFSLMGSVLALREGTVLVQGTPSNEVELIGELRELVGSLGIERRMLGWRNALKSVQTSRLKGAKWLLLVLDVKNNLITVSPFAARKEAEIEIARLEQTKSGDLDAVLVWVDSFRSLPKAYPNYYADTGEFLTALRLALK